MQREENLINGNEDVQRGCEKWVGDVQKKQLVHNKEREEIHYVLLIVSI
jgi:hypothetical protein